MNEPVDLGSSEIFFDGITDVKIVEGVTRFALYAHRDQQSVIVARLAIPLSELPEVIQALVIRLTEVAKIIVKPVATQ